MVGDPTWSAHVWAVESFYGLFIADGLIIAGGSEQQV